MAVDSVVCPCCGRETLVTIPIGQQLVKIEKWRHEVKKLDDSVNVSACKCPRCGDEFYAVTKFL